VLVVDELDSNIHPRLVNEIVELFNSSKNNRHNAQLIFNTHNTTLLDSDLFRRDQIWFTEKDRFGAATLFSLADFKPEVRKTENFEHNYLLGKYLRFLMSDEVWIGKTIEAGHILKTLQQNLEKKAELCKCCAGNKIKKP